MDIKKSDLENIEKWMKEKADSPDGWIYIGNKNERYLLGQPGKRNILVFGVNPSTAVPGKDDPTIRKVRNIVQHEGYDGWIMVNLYPLISTKPDDLPEESDEKLVKNNLDVLEAVVKSYYIDRIWAAWGDIIEKRFYLGDGLYNIQELLCCIDAEWYYRGSRTKKGNPRHPLYMRLDEPMNWFAVADYAALWRYADIC